jgi:hypothetical protein
MLLVLLVNLAAHVCVYKHRRVQGTKLLQIRGDSCLVQLKLGEVAGGEDECRQHKQVT